MNFIEVEDYPDIFGNQGFFGITEGFFFFLEMGINLRPTKELKTSMACQNYCYVAHKERCPIVSIRR